jgi:single-stranded-DNA-specific exonuclease
MAAGLTLGPVDYERFAAAFEDATRASADGALFQRTIATDGELAPADLAFSLVEAVEGLVWGQGFPPPLFANVFEVIEQRLVKDRHLKLGLDLDGRRINGIFFRRTDPLPRRARLAYRPAIDEYGGQRRLTLIVEQCESSG